MMTFPPIRNSASGSANFDLIVIGTGAAGVAAAIRAAELGRGAAIIEAGTIGGTCVNVGCVPSKTLIRAAEAYHTAGHHPFEGIATQASGVDWPALIAHKGSLVSSLRQSKYVDVLASYGDAITVIEGRARITPDGKVKVDGGPEYRAGKIVVATGARPRILPLEGIDDVGVLDSTSAMALKEQPRSLIVIGGRAVALELGQTFARLGTKVTILQRGERILPEHEPELSGALSESLQREGVNIVTNVTPIEVRVDGAETTLAADVDGLRREFQASRLLMAVGRTANIDGLGLAEVGVEKDQAGFIEVDEYLRTTNANIYAAGDVAVGPKLVYVAARAGGLAAENALSGDTTSLDLSVVPDVIFTDPQVARVGLTESEARARDIDVKVSTLPLEHVPRALAARDTRGLVKLVVDRASDRLLGAHVLAAEGGEVIQTAAIAVQCGSRCGFTVTDLREMLFPYLVQVEGLKLAAQTLDKDVSQLSCCAG